VAHLLSSLTLVTLATVAGIGAVSAEKEEPREPVEAAPSPATPVLSARRVPELLAAPQADAALVADLQAVVDRQPGTSCLMVSSAGRDIFLDDPDLPLVPASITKLVTAVAALEVLGPDHVFRTPVVAESAPVDGVVEQAWLVGSGDPLLATSAYVSRFETQPQTATLVEPLAETLAAAGVTSIGTLVGDGTRYDADRYPDSWPERFVDQDQSGPLSALAVNDSWEEFPPLPDVDEPDEAPAADPDEHAARVVAGVLDAGGVTVGSTGSGAAPDSATVELGVLESPPLTDVVGQMLRESENHSAELLLKEIAVARGRPGTTAEGVQIANQVLVDLGLPAGGSVVTDGSGLGDGNALSCALVQALLERSGPESALGRGLPVAGETGTLHERFLGVDATGRLAAKTGTLNQATALAGFVDTVAGARLTFAWIVNLEGDDVVDEGDLAIQDDLAAVLVAHPQGPPLTALGPR
jgi:D-alanyl-D-alanine carboxypeptidase/D-alanyl-D-alanine-endopeptidase (penicillin-binding protein 4)